MSFDLRSLTAANLTSKALLQETTWECIFWPADFLLSVVLSPLFVGFVLLDDPILVELFLVLVERVERLLRGGDGRGGLLGWGGYRFVQRGVFGGSLA